MLDWPAVICFAAVQPGSAIMLAVLRVGGLAALTAERFGYLRPSGTSPGLHDKTGQCDQSVTEHRCLLPVLRVGGLAALTAECFGYLGSSGTSPGLHDKTGHCDQSVAEHTQTFMTACRARDIVIMRWLHTTTSPLIIFAEKAQSLKAAQHAGCLVSRFMAEQLLALCRHQKPGATPDAQGASSLPAAVAGSRPQDSA